MATAKTANKPAAKSNPFAELDKKKAAKRPVKPEAEETVEETLPGLSTADVPEEKPAKAEKSAEPAEQSEKSTAPKTTARRTAKQVEEEAARRERAMQEQIDALKKALEGKADVSDISVVADRVVLEDGIGGDVRVIGGGKSLVNNDWRATAVDSLRLMVGRANTQSTQQLALPITLVASLAELLSNVDEITE